MTEDEAAKARSQAREFPETMEVLAKVRAALAEQVFLTPTSAKDMREDLYTRVQAIDALQTEMSRLLAGFAGEQEIRAYVESLATTGK